MNCDTGNLSYVDKVKLIAEQIENSILSFTSENWSGDGNLTTDDNTLQKVLDKFYTYTVTDKDVKIDTTNLSVLFDPEDKTLDRILEKLDTLALDNFTEEQIRNILEKVGRFPYVQYAPNITSPNFVVGSNVTDYLAVGTNGTYTIQLPSVTDAKHDMITISTDSDTAFYKIIYNGVTLSTISGVGSATFEKTSGEWRVFSQSNPVETVSYLKDIYFDVTTENQIIDWTAHATFSGEYLSLSKKADSTYNQNGVEIVDSENKILVYQVTNPIYWTVFGGDADHFSAFSIRDENTIRLADLGVETRVVDITLPNPITILENYYIKTSVTNSILTIEYSTDNANWLEYISVDLLADAPTIVNWKIKNVMGFACDSTTIPVAKNITIFSKEKSVIIEHNKNKYIQQYTSYFDYNVSSDMLESWGAIGEIQSSGYLVASKNGDNTNSHSAVVIKPDTKYMVYKHIIDDDWVCFGGVSKDSFSAVNIGYRNLRLADLGASVTTKDIAVPEILDVNDWVKIRVEDTTLIIDISKDDKNTWINYCSIDLPTEAPEIVNWTNGLKYGFVTPYTSQRNLAAYITAKISDISYLINDKNNTMELKWRGKTWGALGDSITYRGDYMPPIETRTGLICTNLGVSSSTVAINNTYLQDQSLYERLLVAEDKDFWTVFGGVNDWLYYTPLGDPGSTDTTTFYGALKGIAENLLGRPNKPKILFFTALQSNRNGPNSTTGLTMEDYNNAIRETCHYYSIPFVDLYYEGGINPYNLNEMTVDGIHPTPEGAELFAPLVSNKINSMK